MASNNICKNAFSNRLTGTELHVFHSIINPIQVTLLMFQMFFLTVFVCKQQHRHQQQERLIFEQSKERGFQGQGIDVI